MTKHMTEWLGAYLDRELSGPQRRQVESHLAECEICQARLDELQTLSTLLQETAPAGEFIPTERFIANLTLNLPRQTTAETRPRKALEIGWWLIPVSVLGTWVFIQITFSLSSVMLVVADAGLLGSNLAWLQGNPPQTQWFATLMQLFGGQLGFVGQTALIYLNNADLFIQNLTNGFIWQAILATLYLGWLSSWWFRQQKQSSYLGTFSQS